MDEFRDQEMQEVAGTVSARDLSDIVGQGDGYRDLNQRGGEILNGNILQDPTISHSSTEKEVSKSDDPKMFSMDLTPPSTPQDEPLSSNAEQISLESAESAMGYLKDKDSPESQERLSDLKDADFLMGNSDHEEDGTLYTKQETLPSEIIKESSPLNTLENKESSFLDEDVPSYNDSYNKSPSPVHENEGGTSTQHDFLSERLETEPSPIPQREPSPTLTFEKELSPIPQREPSPTPAFEKEPSPIPQREPSPTLTFEKESSPVLQREASPTPKFEKEPSPLQEREPSPNEYATNAFEGCSPDLSKESSTHIFDKPDSSQEPSQEEQHSKFVSDDQFRLDQPESHSLENHKELSPEKTFEKDPSLPEVIKTEPSPTYPSEKDFTPVSEKETESSIPIEKHQDQKNENTQEFVDQLSSSQAPKKEDMPLKDPIQTDIMKSLSTKESSESPYEPQLTPEPDVLLSTPQGGTPEPESPSQMTPEPSIRDECITPPSPQQVTEASDISFDKEISDYMQSQVTSEKLDKPHCKDILQGEREASVFSTPEPDSTTSTILNITALTDAWLQKLPPVVLDLIYWRDTQKSGVVYGSGMAFLLLLRWMSLISVISYMSLFALTATMSFRIYKNVMQAIQKTQDGHPFKEYLDMDVTIPEDKVKHTTEVALTKLNCMVSELRRLFLVEDFVDSLKFGVLLWCLTYIGSWFNSSTLIILGYVALFTLPKVYEINQTQIDQYIDLVRTQFEEIQAKVRGLIPLGGSKEKAQ